MDDGRRLAAFSPWELGRGEIVCTLNAEIPIKSGQTRPPRQKIPALKPRSLLLSRLQRERRGAHRLWPVSRVEHCFGFLSNLEAAFLAFRTPGQPSGTGGCVIRDRQPTLLTQHSFDYAFIPPYHFHTHPTIAQSSRSREQEWSNCIVLGVRATDIQGWN